MIVVMKDGVVSNRSGSPQNVYDSPVNLFVAKFWYPPINVFGGTDPWRSLYIGENAVLLTPGLPTSRFLWESVRGFISMRRSALLPAWRHGSNGPQHLQVVPPMIDAIGLSFYSFWHGTFMDLKDTMSRLIKLYNLPTSCSGMILVNGSTFKGRLL